MASKGKRAGTATPQPQPGGTSTPLTGITRPGSPLSPTRHSRLQEKAELQNLNDRLATYIDRVRNLETENARLVIENQTTHESISRETTKVRTIYESELSDARRLLDETAREKAKLEIDTKRLWEQNEELKAKLDKKTKDCAFAEGNARMYESRATELSSKLSAALGDKKKLNDDLAECQKELDRLRKQLDETRKCLEEETLARVDLENNIQSLREELAFKDQVHSQEVNETRSRRQVELTEIDGRLAEQYEAKLAQSLQELREQYEAQMRANRDEIEHLYESKIKGLQAATNRQSHATSSAIEELRTSRSRIDGLVSKINELEAINAQLNAQYRDLQLLLDQERARFSDERADLLAEIGRLRDEMAQQLQEYQDLMDIKVSLDLEIAAYDKLLCGEESRLNITPSSSQASVTSLSHSLSRATRATPIRKTPSRGPSVAGGTKRKRTMVDESDDVNQSEYYVSSSAKGDIHISEIDPEGKFVKLHNKGPKEIHIGGWQLVRSTVGGNETSFKFHRSVKIEPGATITVWSSDVGVNHEPPTNIVMKTQKWFVGDNMKTLLYNADNEEVAGLDRIKRTVVRHVSRQRTHSSLGAARYGTTTVDGVNSEDIINGHDAQRGEEKCRLM